MQSSAKDGSLSARSTIFARKTKRWSPKHRQFLRFWFCTQPSWIKPFLHDSLGHLQKFLNIILQQSTPLLEPARAPCTTSVPKFTSENTDCIDCMGLGWKNHLTHVYNIITTSLQHEKMKAFRINDKNFPGTRFTSASRNTRITIIKIVFLRRTWELWSFEGSKFLKFQTLNVQMEHKFSEWRGLVPCSFQWALASAKVFSTHFWSNATVKHRVSQVPQCYHSLLMHLHGLQFNESAEAQKSIEHQLNWTLFPKKRHIFGR